MQIRRNGTQPFERAAEEYFTGAVWIDWLFDPPEPARVFGLTATFEPGARTAWHCHPLGQTLIVTAGRGWVQRRGGPIEVIEPGDVVSIAPGEHHWHGATPTTGMSHYAILEKQDGKVTWFEKVSDEEYLKGPGSG